MDPLALACLALAAILHAAWNVLLKTAGDPLRRAAVGMATASAVAVPVGLVAWAMDGGAPVPAEIWLVGLLSGVVETAYFAFLSEAYRRGDLSVVYPIARGSAPLLAVLAGVVLLGERLPPSGWLGVGLLLAGLLAIQRPWRFAGAGADGRGAAGFALLTGVAIATYSALDRVGVGLAPVWLYGAILWPAGAVGLAVMWLARRRLARTRLTRELAAPEEAPAPGLARSAAVPHARRDDAIAGLLMFATYTLVLVALSLAPLSVVAPMRESAVVLVSAWGVLRLREAVTPRERVIRIAGSSVVLAGTVVLAVGG